MRKAVMVGGTAGAAVGVSLAVGLPLWWKTFGLGSEGALVPFWLHSAAYGGYGLIAASVAVLLLGIRKDWTPGKRTIPRLLCGVGCVSCFTAAAVLWLEPLAPLFTGDLALGRGGPGAWILVAPVEPPPAWTTGGSRRLAWRANAEGLLLEAHQYAARESGTTTVKTNLLGRWRVAGNELVPDLTAGPDGTLTFQATDRDPGELPGSGAGALRVLVRSDGRVLELGESESRGTPRRIDLGEGMAAEQVMWLPDERRLVCYARWHEPNAVLRRLKRFVHRAAADVLVVVDPESGKTRRMLTRFGCIACCPVRSPDGRWVAFTTYISWWHDEGLGPWQRMFIVNIVDGALVPVTDASADAGRPVWSPDGKWLAFMAWTEEAQAFLPWAAYIGDGARNPQNPGT